MSISSITKYLSNLNRARLEKRRQRRAKKGVMRGKRTATHKFSDGGRKYTVYGEIAKYDAPSLEFEEPASHTPPSHVQAKMVCFYLPQFHAVEENNLWWGEGFTEWRNVSRAVPRFAGHYQPRIPRDLGFYDLTDQHILRRQAALARAAGITGFSFYYYNFDGRRILQRPIEAFLADQDIDIEFCLTWANENWTRRWDGLDQDVLLEQTYGAEYEEEFTRDVCRHFSDPRYIRIDGRPLFIIYRPGIIPDFAQWLLRFKQLCRDSFGENPYILMVQGFGTNDPRKFGLDGAVEFPPHKLLDNLQPAKLKDVFDPNFAGTYFSYEDLIESSCSQQPVDFDVVKCVVPGWDNEARKPGRGMGFINSSPSKYERWLARVVKMSVEKPLAGKHPFVFVNAWNEWAEGAYLEPDVHYGHAYLNATRRALTGATVACGVTSVLLVGHDAHPHGAQLLLLNLARTLKESLGCKVAVCLLEGGPLLHTYAQEVPVFVISMAELGWQDTLFREATSVLGNDFEAICNTTVCGPAVAALKRKSIPVISLIHELPNLIRERHLQGAAKLIARHADSIVFPSAIVRDAFSTEIVQPVQPTVIRPQGIYQDLLAPRRARRAVCEELGIPEQAKIVINTGYGDLRKGIDLFIKMAEQVTAARDDVYFVWIGKIDQGLWQWLGEDLPQDPAKRRIIVAGYQEKPLDYVEAADAFALTSREDPFPSVVLEALALGVPVIAYAGSGGHCELLADIGNGRLAEAFRIDAFAGAVMETLAQETPATRQRRAEHNRSRFDFSSYAFDLLNLIQPGLKKVSVIITCYNQRRYIRERLTSIFSQTYPIHEIFLVDDASTDGSAEKARQTTAEFGRRIKIVQRNSNSGSAFGNWRDAVEQASGDLVWIAEGDDSADPDFVRRLAGSMGRDCIFSFADARQIDGEGRPLDDSYYFYLKSIAPDYFQHGGEVPAQKFLDEFLSVRNCILNVSGVLFQKAALAKVLRTLHGDIMSFRLAGDWRLYAALLAIAHGTVSYVPKSLNVHRRHEKAGVTSTLDPVRHLDEIKRMHGVLLAAVSAGEKSRVQQAQKLYIDELAQRFRVNATKDSATIGS